MKNELLEKIRSTITQGTNSEGDVVYLLVLIRKFLNRLDEEGIDISVEYGHLLFHCDWALHIALDRSKVIGLDLISLNTQRITPKKMYG